MKYTQKNRIARNGPGEIVLAECHTSDSSFPVILKFVIPELTKEIKGKLMISKMFNHPFVQKVIDFGIGNEFSSIYAYYACKHISGITLTKLLKRLSLLNKELPFCFRHHIMCGVCSCLSYVNDFFGSDHMDYLPHGNIHPDNILISFTGDIFLVDSGIGNIVNFRYNGEELKRNETTVFTHPEIFKHTTRLKKIHELYSAGMLFYYLNGGYKNKLITTQISEKKISDDFLHHLPSSLKIIISHLIFPKSGTDFCSISEVLKEIENMYTDKGQFQKQITSLLLYILFKNNNSVSMDIQSFLCKNSKSLLNSTEDESVKQFLLDLSRTLLRKYDTPSSQQKEFMSETKSFLIPKEYNEFNNESGMTDDQSIQSDQPQSDYDKLKNTLNTEESEKSGSLVSRNSPLISAFSRIMKDPVPTNMADNGLLKTRTISPEITANAFDTFSTCLKSSSMHGQPFSKLIKKKDGSQ